VGSSDIGTCKYTKGGENWGDIVAADSIEEVENLVKTVD
jgi:hypothetical protein